MSTDPVQSSDVSVKLPEEADDAADYEAVYAELVSTRSGRRFLREFADRTRGAETQALADAIARVEAAVRGEPVPQIPAALTREFGELIAALGRIEAEIAASAALPNAVSAAAERIQDVAFMLRERDLDAALCDALEAAAGELGDAFARGNAAAERAIALLQDVSRRINALMAGGLSSGGPDAAPAQEPVAAQSPASEAAPWRDDDGGQTGVSEPAAAAMAPDVILAALASAFSAGEEYSAPNPPGGGSAAAEESASQDRADDSFASKGGSSEHVSRAGLPNVPAGEAAEASATDIDDVGSLSEGESTDVVLLVAQVPVGPDEDPGDLFEPLPMPAPIPLPPKPFAGAASDAAMPTAQHDDAGAPAQIIAPEVPTQQPDQKPADENATPPVGVAASANLPAAQQPATPATAPTLQMSPEAEQLSSSRPDAPPAGRVVSRAAADDPLAAVRALSEEELISLFS